MIDYTVKRKFIRHKWRGKKFSIFDRESFLYDSLAMEIRREIDNEIIAGILAAFKRGDDSLIEEQLYHGTEEDHEDRQAGGSEDETQG